MVQPCANMSMEIEQQDIITKQKLRNQNHQTSKTSNNYKDNYDSKESLNPEDKNESDRHPINNS